MPSEQNAKVSGGKASRMTGGQAALSGKIHREGRTYPLDVNLAL